MTHVGLSRHLTYLQTYIHTHRGGAAGPRERYAKHLIGRKRRRAAAAGLPSRRLTFPEFKFTLGAPTSSSSSNNDDHDDDDDDDDDDDSRGGRRRTRMMKMGPQALAKKKNRDKVGRLVGR